MDYTSDDSEDKLYAAFYGINMTEWQKEVLQALKLYTL